MARNNRINIVISADDKASRPIRDVADAMDDGEKKSNRLGQAFGALGRVAAAAAVTGVLTLSTGVVAASKASFDQVVAVEKATFALRAYEKDGQKVNQILSELISYARSDMGVLFQREDLFKAASNLRGFGEEAGKVTERVKILSKGVALGMTTFDELSQIIGRSAQSGKLTAEAYDQLAYRGIILDKSLRGAEVSADGLYDALSKALPDEILAGRADTIEGRFIRLQSAFRDVGATILGVDKETTKFVEGGLGDRFIKGVDGVTAALKSPQFKEGFARATQLALSFGDTVVGIAANELPKLVAGAVEVGTQIGDYLAPKFSELWLILTESLMPALGRLWKEFLEPLVPVLGTALVLAFGAVVDGAGLFLQAVSGVINFLSSNQWVIWAIVGAFTAFKAALAIQEAQKSFGVAMDVINGKISSARNNINGMNTNLGSIGWMAAGAAASIGLQIVIDKTLETMDVVRKLGDALGQSAAEGAKTDKAIKKMADEGKISQERYQEYIRNTERTARNSLQATQHMYDGFFGPLNKAFDNLFVRMSGAQEKFRGSGFGGFAAGTNAAPGGWTWVGERGPELMRLPQGSQVMQSYRSRSQDAPGGSGPTVVIQNLNTYNNTDYNRMLSDIGFALELAS